jgi:NTE family protein
VAIGSRLYIDGGVHSHSNLDLLAGRGLDAVIVLNPMSSGAWVAGSGGVRERLAALRRRRSAAQLAGEVAALRAEGTRVLVLEPAFADIAAMGSNMMARDRRGEVLEAGRASTERALARLGRKRLRSVGLSPG